MDHLEEMANQLRLVVEIPLFIGFQHHPRWLAGFQPSTVSHNITQLFLETNLLDIDDTQRCNTRPFHDGLMARIAYGIPVCSPSGTCRGSFLMQI